MQYIELFFVENYVMFVENALSVYGYPSYRCAVAQNGYPSNVAQQVFNAVGARPAESGQSCTVCGACVVFAETLRGALRFLCCAMLDGWPTKRRM